MSNGLRSLPLAVLLTVAAVACAPALCAARDAEPPRSFYMDRRAAQVGDMFTVIVTEFSTVAATARTQTSKEESAQASLVHANGETDAPAVNFGTDFAGGGQIERSGKLLAKIAVTVHEIDERGNLVIHGEQEIHVNNERQRIQLDGVVRAEDIGPDNTIPSWRVGAARIELTGKGLLARKQGPGLITRMLSWIWE